MKTIMLVSEGFSCGRDARLDNPRDPEDLASLAAAARAEFYVVQPNNAMLIDASRKLEKGLPDAEVERRDKAANVLSVNRSKAHVRARTSFVIQSPK